MSRIVDTILNYVRPYFFIIFVLCIFILFSVAGYYGYQKYTKSIAEKTKFSDVANANRTNKTATIYMFHVDWCPHCVKALPEFEKFKTAYDGQQINGYKLKCIAVNCTDDEKDDITATIKKYNIQSYPTVKLVIDGGETIEFDSKITQKSLHTFVTTVIPA
jgi:thiol-disulfide isomerase/thioredoxin